MEILKVSSKSNPNSVAGAVANILKVEERIDVQVIGAGALNQLVKSIIICRGFLAPLGKDIACFPSFCDIIVEGVEKTAIRFTIETLKK